MWREQDTEAEKATFELMLARSGLYNYQLKACIRLLKSFGSFRGAKVNVIAANMHSAESCILNPVMDLKDTYSVNRRPF